MKQIIFILISILWIVGTAYTHDTKVELKKLAQELIQVEFEGTKNLAKEGAVAQGKLGVMCDTGYGVKEDKK